MVDNTSRPDRGASSNRLIPYRRVADVAVSTGGEGAKTRFFLRTRGGSVFAFGEQEHFIWKSLDGRASFADVTQAFETQFGVALTPRYLSEFIDQGMRSGIIERTGNASDEVSYHRDLAAAEHPASQTESLAGPKRAAPRHGFQHATPFGKEPWTVIVGDPTRLFAFLGLLFGPMRHVRWLCAPATLVACMIILKHWSQYEADYVKVVTSIPFWPCVYVYEHVINILARTIEGVIIQYQGAPVRYFGFRFFMGILMRTFIDERGARSIPESARLWSKGGALMLRLALFDVGMFAWIAFQPAHPSLELAALFFSEIALLTFFLNICPLVTGEGYELLVSYLGQPKLAGRAFRVVSINLGGRNLPAAMSTSERIALFLFAVGTILFTGALLLKILLDMGGYITSNVQGLGYFIMTIVFIGVGVYFYLIVAYHKKFQATLNTMVAEGHKSDTARTRT